MICLAESAVLERGADGFPAFIPMSAVQLGPRRRKGQLALLNVMPIYHRVELVEIPRILA